MLVILSELSTDKPDEMVRLVLVRAKFCELLGNAAGLLASECADLYLTGLFSLLDAMLEQPMANVLNRLPISSVVKDTLLGRQSSFAFFLRLAESFEKNQPASCRHLQNTLSLTGIDLQQNYLEAVKYANHLA
jgi:c-di-GMP-related signal transduction protein